MLINGKNFALELNKYGKYISIEQQRHVHVSSGLFSSYNGGTYTPREGKKITPTL